MGIESNAGVVNVVGRSICARKVDSRIYPFAYFLHHLPHQVMLL
jgi:hypothetical protein